MVAPTGRLGPLCCLPEIRSKALAVDDSFGRSHGSTRHRDDILLWYVTC